MKFLRRINPTQEQIGGLPIQLFKDGDQIIVVMNNQRTFLAVIRVQGSQCKRMTN